MKTWTITTPYTVELTIRSETFIEVDEDQVLEHFEVDSVDDIDPAELDAYLKECGEDNAYHTPDELIIEQFKSELPHKNYSFHTDTDDYEVEVEDDEDDEEELEAAQ